MQGTLGQRTGWPVSSELRRGDPVTAPWAGWRRGGGRGPRNSASRRPGQHLWRLQPAVWASTFPVREDGSVALGFMVSLEDRRAGRFTRDLQPFHGADGGLSSGRHGPGHHPLPAPRLRACWRSWACILSTSSSRLSSASAVGYTDSRPTGPSSDASHHPRLKWTHFMSF